MLRRYLTRTISVALLLLLIGAGVGLVVFQARGGKLLSVQTGSMEPNIKKGSLVAIKKVPSSEIKRGDVITYATPDKQQTITHRVVSEMPSPMKGGRPYFITKGDANPATDAPVQEAAVRGKVEAGIPYAGHVIDQLRKPLGLILILYIPAFIVVAYEIRRLTAYYRQIRPYNANSQRPSASRASMAVLVLFLALGITGASVAPALAALQSTAVLAGNTISGGPFGQPEEPPVNETVCNNNTSINVNNNADQNASSGSVNNSGNTNGGSATSGSANNSNSTSVNIGINNNCSRTE